jgi:hypothetical protein
MNQIPSDEELRAVIPAMSRFAGIPIDANRLDAVAPAYQNLLRDVERKNEVLVPAGIEPAIGFVVVHGGARGILDH